MIRRAALVVVLILASTANAANEAEKYVFLSDDSRLTDAENAAVLAALARAGRSLGLDVVEPASTRPIIEKLRTSGAADERTCGVGVRREADLLKALEQHAGFCGGRCALTPSSWSVQCVDEWDACSVSFHSKDARHALVVPHTTVRSWRSVDDLVKEIASAPKTRWKRLDKGGIATMGGLSSVFGGLRKAEMNALTHREPLQPSVNIRIDHTLVRSDFAWSLLEPIEYRGQKRTLLLDPELLSCWPAGTAPEGGTLRARRTERGISFDSNIAPPTLKCLEAAMAEALAKEPGTDAGWLLSLTASWGDISTRSGKYLIEAHAHPTQAGKGGVLFGSNPIVSDPALSSWEVPWATPIKRCLVEFPFKDDFARSDYEKRMRMVASFDVSFDALGKATSAKVAKNKKAGPHLYLTKDMTACLERALLTSRAPCSSAGGTVTGSIEADASVAVQ